MMAPLDVQSHEATLAYADHCEHLAHQLQWLDRLLQHQVTLLRSQTQSVQRLAASRQVYIADEEVDFLLEAPGATEIPDALERGWDTQLADLQRQLHARVTASLEQGVMLPLMQLAHTFGLSPFEVQAVLICLAPELHRKYDRLYAYLQDDITRKKPSVELVLTLLCPTLAERWRASACFAPHAPLRRAGILQTIDDPQNPSGSSDLGRFLRLDERILRYLLGDDRLAEPLRHYAALYHPQQRLEEVPVEAASRAAVRRVIEHYFSKPSLARRQVLVYLHGPAGVGKRQLALGACGLLSCPLLSVDLELLLAHEDVETLLRLVLREGLLQQAALYLEHVDVLRSDEPKTKGLLKILANLIADYGWLVFLAGEKSWLPGDIFAQMVFQSIAVPWPEVPLRTTIWQQALARQGMAAPTDWAAQLANQFRLTPSQIEAAATFAETQRVQCSTPLEVTLPDLYAACRRQSQHRLGDLALHITPRYGWQDLVLVAEKLTQLQEICSQARYRYRVLDDWGFDRKLSHGKGLSVLFCGPPGTGKTMAAEAIALDLQVDLYKVDLSGVVSKYIGETEKNLARIFQEAENSNAILFFDEADALFGKRTEVSDAHDRYANIETSYLLQKMEDYAGIVILATNLRDNMDDAFTRRLRFIVEFPFPDEASRALIWQGHFPAQAPVSPDIDYAFLAKKFPLAGGNIKNIVLHAAFCAAERDEKIGMKHLLYSSQREYEKIGKLWI